MNSIKELTCIVCPRGCLLHIDGNMEVSGNGCIRGKTYAIQELTKPKRMVTSTIKVIDGTIPLLPVVTSSPIDKDLIFKLMEEINKKKVVAPVHINDIIIKNVLGTGVDIIACRNILKK